MSCQICSWNHDKWDKADPRYLKLHHIHHHVDGGENSVENLITLCTVRHDKEHDQQGIESPLIS